VVDEGSWTQPELGAVLSTGIHDREVVHSRFQELSLLLLSQLCNTADQGLDLLVLEPLLSGSQLASHMAFD